MGRTGSTWLTKLLDSHPQIECRGELFRPGGDFEMQTSPGIDRRNYLSHHAFVSDCPIQGFKMPYNWIINYPGIIDDFRALNYRLIRLTRRSLLDHYLSIQLADRNNNWTSQTEHREQRMTVDPYTLLMFQGQRLMVEEALTQMSAGLPTAAAEYEGLHSPDTHRRLLEFLGADDRPLTTTTRRSRPIATQDAVINYREVAAFFQRRNDGLQRSGLRIRRRLRRLLRPDTPAQLGL